MKGIKRGGGGGGGGFGVEGFLVVTAYRLRNTVFLVFLNDAKNIPRKFTNIAAETNKVVHSRLLTNLYLKKSRQMVEIATY